MPEASTQTEFLEARTRPTSVESAVDASSQEDLWDTSIDFIRDLTLDSVKQAHEARGHLARLGSVDTHTLTPPPFHEYVEWYLEKFELHNRRMHLLSDAGAEIRRIKREREEE